MKANEAPEKLYIALNEFTEDGRTFVLDHRTDYPICTEYARTDAFIEKAEKWIYEHILDYVYAKEWGQGVGVEGELFDDFKDYMKGE